MLKNTIKFSEILSPAQELLLGEPKNKGEKFKCEFLQIILLISMPTLWR